MSFTFLFVICFCTPSVVEPPVESIAVVDLRECFRHVPTARSDRATLSQSIEETDAEAKKLVEALKESEYYAQLGNSTEEQKTEARLRRLEFDAYRHREQARLRKVEQDMFKKWHKQVNTAVKTVAQREGFTIILYSGENNENMDVSGTDPQSMLTRTHLGFVRDQHRFNITAKIVAEMSTEAFADSVLQENKTSAK